MVGLGQGSHGLASADNHGFDRDSGMLNTRWLTHFPEMKYPNLIFI
jgi:hypothetical protein